MQARQNLFKLIQNSSKCCVISGHFNVSIFSKSLNQKNSQMPHYSIKVPTFASFFATKKIDLDNILQPKNDIKNEERLPSQNEFLNKEIICSSEDQSKDSSSSCGKQIQEQEKIPDPTPNLYSNVLKRVIKTCRIYLDSSPEKRSLIQTNSRFSYVKKRIDPLSLDEEENFKAFLKEAEKLTRTTQKVLSDGKTLSKTKRISLYPAKIKKFLKEEQNGPILCSLLLEFVENDNLDRLWMINPQEDEVDIGKVQKVKKRPKYRVINILSKCLPKLQMAFEELREIIEPLKAEQIREILEQRNLSSEGKKRISSFIYTHVFNRVINTCKIYLNSTPEERNSVGPESRFYYVKQFIDQLNYEEEQNLKEYLEHAQSLFLNNKKAIRQRKYFLIKLKKPLSQNPREGNSLTNDKISQEKVYAYTYPINNLPKKIIGNYLKTDKNGDILKNMILEFLSDENPDLKWDLNTDEDEVAIGKIEKTKKRKKSMIFRNLTVDLRKFKMRFQHLQLELR